MAMYCARCEQITCVTVRKWGFIVHQVQVCECDLYDALRALTRVYSSKPYAIALKRFPLTDEARPYAGHGSVELISGLG